MTHARPAGNAAARETGITRLVAAEREWKEALERAESDAARLVEEARAADAAADAAVDREIERLLAARTIETQNALRERSAELRRQAEARAARYDGAGVALESRIAAEIADRLWGASAPAQALAGDAT